MLKAISTAFNRVVAAAIVSGLALTTSGCAQQQFEFAEIEDGIREITRGPCLQPESVGFLDSTSMVTACWERNVVRLSFASLVTGRVTREISVPHRLHGGGVLHVNGTDYWSVIADNVLESSSRASPKQGLLLYSAGRGAPLRVVFNLDQDENVVGASLNTNANCAVLRTQTGRGTARTAFTAQLLLLDLDRLVNGGGVPAILDLSTERDSVHRIPSSPDRRADHPGRHMAGPTQATCLRGPDGAVSMVYSYSRRYGEGARSWTTAIQRAEFGRTDDSVSADLTAHTTSFKAIYSSETRDEIVAVIEDDHTPRFVNNRLLVIGGGGQTQDIPPLPAPLGWQYFDPRLDVGLAIHSGENGPDEGLLTIVNCTADVCRTRPSSLRIRGPLQFIGGSEGQQIVIGCVIGTTEACDRRQFVIDFRSSAFSW